MTPIHTFELYHDPESCSYQDERYQQSDCEYGMWLCESMVRRLLPSNIINSPQVTLNVYSEEKQHCFEFKIHPPERYRDDGNVDISKIGEGIELNWTVTELAEELGLLNKTLYGEFV